MNKFYLGIDTSAYTTSIAIIDDYGKLITDYRQVLNVNKGKRGLRQQEAVFQHINNIPILINKLEKEVDFNDIIAVASSIKPRNIESSYMPVFKVGQMQSHVLSKVLKVPYKKFSHQDGHIAAGLFSIKKQFNKFLALHISGGTTELLKVEENEDYYNCEIIGGTKDISAGQLVDRIGVKLGLEFPCGKHLEKISKNGQKDVFRYPINTNGTWINFSGAETHFSRLINESKFSIEDISKNLFFCIGKVLKDIIKNAILTYKIKDIIVIGGVASNSTIRHILMEDIADKGIGNVYFPEPKFCTDNAIGIAYLGSMKNGFNKEAY